MKELKDWLNYIESFHPNEIELGLERVKSLAKKLNLIDQNAKVIIVGGTNGKGSCVATLESLAICSNLKIGCYTSPHLIQFNERIRVNGKNASDQLLVSTFELINKARQQLKITFFEFTTLVALSIFKNANLDLVVLEVGLGGRLDAVNIIEPDVTIITTIDKDHESWLGSELNDIAFEKSGICRQKSVNLVGDLKSYQLVKLARPEITFALTGQEFSNQSINQVSYSNAVYQSLIELVNDPAINPCHLLEQNIMLAITAFRKLYFRALSSLNLKQVIKNIELKGRFQQIADNPKIVLDVGHNVQAGRNLSKQIDNAKCDGTRFAICGLMADKAIIEFLEVMDGVIDQWYFVDLPTARAAKAIELQKIYQKIVSPKSRVKYSFVESKTSYTVNNTVNAYRKVKEQAGEKDQIYILGSFVTVAEILHYYTENC